MTKREIVYRAIDRTGPSRIPIHYCNRDFEFSDTVSVTYSSAKDFVPSEPGASEWGFVWEVLDKTMGQPRSNPLRDWDCVATYIPPDPHAAGRLDDLAHLTSGTEDRFIRFSLGITGFNQATFLRGFEDFLADLHDDRRLVERTLDFVFGFENALIEKVLKYPIDAVTFGDDWGTQNDLIIAPSLWREVFRPRYAEQFARIHSHGKRVWFHTCGQVSSIIGDLIEIGADVIELLQPDLLGVDRLAREFGGQVCFCCSVDHQRVAISGTKQEIFDYAKRLCDTLGAFNGGFIAYIEDYSCLGMSERNYQWIREAFHAVVSER
ncbi:MAG TPA: uroporphyrinogen decarboxylase family protein [bacterium]|nr:uroporphyrinogen decarboxylase family protein [bacterium]